MIVPFSFHDVDESSNQVINTLYYIPFKRIYCGNKLDFLFKTYFIDNIFQCFTSLLTILLFNYPHSLKPLSHLEILPNETWFNSIDSQPRYILTTSVEGRQCMYQFRHIYCFVSFLATRTNSDYSFYAHFHTQFIPSMQDFVTSKYPSLLTKVNSLDLSPLSTEETRTLFLSEEETEYLLDVVTPGPLRKLLSSFLENLHKTG